MGKITTRYLMVLSLFTVFGVLCSRYGHGIGTSIRGKYNGNQLEGFPLQVGGWQGDRQPIEEKIYRILDTDSVLVNLYENGGERVYLTVVYYPEAKVEFHAPEACNTAKGDTLLDMEDREVPVSYQGTTVRVGVNVFAVTRVDGRRTLFYYFFKSGALAGESYTGLRIRMAMDYLRSGETGGAMVVLSTAETGSMGRSMEVLDRFLAAVYPELMERI